MDIESAKKIPLAALLRTLGHEPVKAHKGGVELAYRSPFRKESEPSFFVNLPKNVWFDFGDASGGDALDLLRKLGARTLPDAIAELRRLTEGPLFDADFDFKKVFRERDGVGEGDGESLLITKIEPFGKNRSLAGYLTEQRKIAPGVAAKFLREIHFQQKNQTGVAPKKVWFAAGFANMAGGWELRNPYFKGSVGGKDLSLVVGKTSDTVAIFEGFMDFLTVMTAFSLDTPTNDVIVLNSVANLDRAVLLAHKNGYQKIRSWLDNDVSGKESLGKLIESVACAVEPQNHRYLGFKDVNECYLSTGKIF